MQEHGLSAYDAEQLIKSISLCNCFESAVSVCASPKDVANWMTGEVMSLLNTKQMTCDMLSLNGQKLGELILLVKNGKVGRANARVILDAMFEDATVIPDAYAKEKGFLISNDEEHIKNVVKSVVDADPKSVADYKGGKEKALRKTVMNIVTDCKSLEEVKDPDTCNVVALYKLFATPEELEEMKANYRAGNYGYGHAKQALFEKIWAHFEPMRKRREELEANLDFVEELLRKNGERARAAATVTLDKVRTAVGLK
jgi:hypothetical protein